MKCPLPTSLFCFFCHGDRVYLKLTFIAQSLLHSACRLSVPRTIGGHHDRDNRCAHVQAYLMDPSTKLYEWIGTGLLPVMLLVSDCFSEGWQLIIEVFEQIRLG